MFSVVLDFCVWGRKIEHEKTDYSSLSSNLPRNVVCVSSFLALVSASVIDYRIYKLVQKETDVKILFEDAQSLSRSYQIEQYTAVPKKATMFTTFLCISSLLGIFTIEKFLVGEVCQSYAASAIIMCPSLQRVLRLAIIIKIIIWLACLKMILGPPWPFCSRSPIQRINKESCKLSMIEKR